MAGTRKDAGSTDFRVALCQFANGGYESQLEISRPYHLAGCERFGYTFIVESDASTGKHVFFEKLRMVLDAIDHGFNYVVWLDADTLWDGMQPLTDAMPSPGIGMTFNGGQWIEPWYAHFNAGAYYVHVGNGVRSQLQRWLDTPDDGHPWGDQHSLSKLVRSGRIDVTLIDSRFNSIHGRDRNHVVAAWHGSGMMATKFMSEYLRTIGKPTMNVAFREGSQDRDIWHSVRIKNEYSLHGKWLWDVIDVGAHIGAFTSLVASMGARKIIAVEPDPDNAYLLRFNTRSIKDRVTVIEKAVGCSGMKHALVEDTWPNTGGVSYAESPEGTVETVRLNDLLQDLEGPVLLKLDCEGCEYCAVSSADLSKVTAIVGEFHESWGGQVSQLEMALTSQGFLFSYHYTGAGIGLFGAHKEQVNG